MSNPLPDAMTQRSDDHIFLSANKKARRIIKKGFEDGGPPGSKIANPGILTPEYRALELEDGPVVGMMLHTLHEAGLSVMFQCDNCNRFHFLDDNMAEKFLQEAMAVATTVILPAHETMQ